MLPIVLDPAAIRVGAAGEGEGLKRRLALLAETGLLRFVVFAGRSPTDDELTGLSLLFVAGLPADVSRELAAQARAKGVLVNVEDQPELCDFHVPASVRRGDLLLTVSTGGQSPGLARLLREELEDRFGPEWSDRLEEIARSRSEWRAGGVDPAGVSERTRALVEENGWLP